MAKSLLFVLVIGMSLASFSNGQSTNTTPSVTTDNTTYNSGSGACRDCAIRNGIGYNPHLECDKFIQCNFVRNGNLAGFEIKQCGFGTFWDQTLLTCNFIGQVHCPNDPCINGTVSSYKTSGNCAEHYMCTNRVSQAKLCSSGYAYKNGQCVIDTDCNKDAPPKNCCLRCKFAAIRNDPCFFNWQTNGRTYKMPCPPGTAYDIDACGCITAAYTSCAAVCKPIVHIDFETAEPGEYDNYGAVRQNGQAYFNGNSSIRILRLSNVDFRSRISIYVKYRPEFPDQTTQQAVVSNSDCDKPSTIAIIANGQSTEFLAKSVSRSAQTLNTNSSTVWKEIVYEIKSGTFSGQDGLQRDVTQFAGLLEVSPCAFQLGHGNRLNSFRGWIEYVIITRCDDDPFNSTTTTTKPSGIGGA
ncbi:protein PIF [Patella vulgata]|uniref:protein PIF n=1 Tax=Patella vulgata TaxID=6465 RepID=UPI0021807034|nr:protein PIF [Patella vulgata]